MKMDKALALKVLINIDTKLADAGFGRVSMVIGEKGAMILHHGYSGSTMDIDAVPVNVDFELIKPYADKVAIELKITPDWLNPHFQAFTIYLPEDSKDRMKIVFSGKVLTIKSLGAEDILIMKLMAGRSKDMGHIKHLLGAKPDLQVVEDRLHELIKLFPKEAQKALDRLDDILDLE